MNSMKNHDKTVFIIGNGVSRAPIPLEQLKGTTFGCNALYRDFWPTCLFAVDSRMLKEVMNSEYPNERFWARGNKKGVNMIKWKGSNSGVVAFRHAVEWGFGRIVLLGIDLKGLGAHNDINNIYTGTEHYGKAQNKNPNMNNWVPQFERAIKAKKDYQVIERVLGKESNPMREWEKLGVIQYDVEEFLKREKIANHA